MKEIDIGGFENLSEPIPKGGLIRLRPTCSNHLTAIAIAGLFSHPEMDIGKIILKRDPHDPFHRGGQLGGDPHLGCGGLLGRQAWGGLAWRRRRRRDHPSPAGLRKRVGAHGAQIGGLDHGPEYR